MVIRPTVRKSPRKTSKEFWFSVRGALHIGKVASTLRPGAFLLDGSFNAETASFAVTGTFSTISTPFFLTAAKMQNSTPKQNCINWTNSLNYIIATTYCFSKPERAKIFISGWANRLMARRSKCTFRTVIPLLKPQAPSAQNELATCA